MLTTATNHSPARHKAAGDGQQVLLIKTAWGGKTIDIDFRPPSSAKANSTHPVGPYYLWMIREVVSAFPLPHLFL
jgi:hypothetical protein